MIAVNVPITFISDGCTFPGIFKIFKRIMGGTTRYREYCIEHDFLRRYNIIYWLDADILFAKRIASHGLVGKIRAPFYLLFVVLTHFLYSKTQPLPVIWKEYYEYYNQD